MSEDWDYEGKRKKQYEDSGKVIVWTLLICGLGLLGYGLFEYVKVILNSLWRIYLKNILLWKRKSFMSNTEKPLSHFRIGW